MSVKAEHVENEVSVSAAARAAGVSVRSIHHWMDRGVLSGRRTLYGRVVDAADLERVIRERAAKASAS